MPPMPERREFGRDRPERGQGGERCAGLRGQRNSGSDFSCYKCQGVALTVFGAMFLVEQGQRLCCPLVVQEVRD